MELREWRKNVAKLTQGELAARLGRHQTDIARYELGLRKPPLEVVAKLEEESAGAVTLHDFIDS